MIDGGEKHKCWLFFKIAVACYCNVHSVSEEKLVDDLIACDKKKRYVSWGFYLKFRTKKN